MIICVCVCSKVFALNKSTAPYPILVAKYMVLLLCYLYILKQSVYLVLLHFYKKEAEKKERKSVEKAMRLQVAAQVYLHHLQ